MSAYVIVNIDVKDASAYEEYKTRVPHLIRKHGGEYLVRGGNHVVLEGQWRPHRLVIFRFPDIASAERLFADPEYAPLRALRQSVSTADIVAVEGV